MNRRHLKEAIENGNSIGCKNKAEFYALCDAVHLLGYSWSGGIAFNDPDKMADIIYRSIICGEYMFSINPLSPGFNASTCNGHSVIPFNEVLPSIKRWSYKI